MAGVTTRTMTRNASLKKRGLDAGGYFARHDEGDDCGGVLMPRVFLD